MSQVLKAILARAILGKAFLGAIAVSLTLGAVQFASGHDLTRGQQALNDTPVNVINRSAKTDRAAVAGSAEQTRTISLRPESLADTSVLVRVPIIRKPDTDARNGATGPSLLKSDGRKSPVGCEPSFSVLTEAARQLQPGRCLT